MPINDAAAISVLLARYVRALELRDIDQKLISDANARLAQNIQNIANLKAAFAVFGFDIVNQKDVWDRVREQIGNVPYYSAIDDGKSAIASSVTSEIKSISNTIYNATTSITAAAKPEPDGGQSGAAATSGASSSGADTLVVEPSDAEDDDFIPDEASAEVAETVTPKVRDAVLDRLKSAAQRASKRPSFVNITKTRSQQSCTRRQLE
jgi:hypothetical protein